MKLLFSIFALLATLQISAQDTLTVMQYNLTQYGLYYGGCDATTNSYLDKEGYLKTIVAATLPDILTVEEVSQDVTYHDRLLNFVMNTDGRNWYSRGTRTNYSNSDIVNEIFYDNRKVTMYKQVALATVYRDINLYTFYINTPDLATSSDTAWLTCIVMHLKAGSTIGDASDRTTMVNVVMNYLNALNKAGNYLIMGDFNVYTSDEDCYQALINHANANIRFYDPINMPGDWNNNSSFASVHTQSTHTADNGCMATGGLDDRFDIILGSLDIITGGKYVKYIPSSYHALAQDGLHYNKALTDAPTNTLVSSTVLNALYNNSDHLPVILQLLVDKSTGFESSTLVPFDFYIPAENYGNMGVLNAHCDGTFKVEAFLSTGSLVQVSDFQLSKGYNTVSLSGIPTTGTVVFFRITSPDGYVKVYKALR